MDRRLQLHEQLVELLGNGHVYYQPPGNSDMSYPCFVYSYANEVVQHADNGVYRSTDQYQVTFISRNPDDRTWQKVTALPMAAFDRRFVADNLYHSVLTLHF